ncbi:hypothetical protein B0A48_02257 [Cryoendolithus antarcticus]|uniref:Uncharacterized protein n=1 Tax=Cryoendolithus antarcticus TaxID=1507870 RepID=A0A1V8TN42_9PEZI|nr:hypothetical protein B0A48_02257 [Cryoendolithus antarcticus]
MSGARSTGLDSGIVTIERPPLSDHSDVQGLTIFLLDLVFTVLEQTIPDLASKIKTDKRGLSGMLDDRAKLHRYGTLDLLEQTRYAQAYRIRKRQYEQVQRLLAQAPSLLVQQVEGPSGLLNDRVKRYQRVLNHLWSAPHRS